MADLSPSGAVPRSGEGNGASRGDVSALVQPSVAAASPPARVPNIGVERRAHPSRSSLALKRVFDIVVSACLLIVLVPLVLIVALAVKLDSRGPIFYRVRRVGHRGRPLMMLKFRKMHDEAQGGPLTTGGDPRLTRVGTILTRTRIDELPQLWDVLCGRMSIVGPRPEDPGFVALHPRDYARILGVRPGITGLSQLAYAAESHIINDRDPVEDYITRILPQKLRLDTLYAGRSNILLDISIIRWTFVTVVLRRPVAVNRTTAKMNVRRRRPGESVTVAPAKVQPSPEATKRATPTRQPSPARESAA